MERLPYIDEHSIEIGATCEQVWPALMSVVRTELGGSPALLRGMLGLQPAQAQGDWRGTPRAGDSVSGFEIAEVAPLQRLALRGSHRFSRYALVFELTMSEHARCTVRAKTWAEFPGLMGSAYRALVIGSGAHRVAVGRLLRSVESRV